VEPYLCSPYMPSGRGQGSLPFIWLGVFQFSSCKAHMVFNYARCGGSPRFLCSCCLALDRFFVQRGEGKETCSIALLEGM